MAHSSKLPARQHPKKWAWGEKREKRVDESSGTTKKKGLESREELQRGSQRKKENQEKV